MITIDILGKPGPANVANPLRPGRAKKILVLLARILGAFALIGMSLFCVFGFLASFEPGNGSLWKIGYGTLACGCLFGAVALLRGR